MNPFTWFDIINRNKVSNPHKNEEFEIDPATREAIVNGSRQEELIGANPWTNKWQGSWLDNVFENLTGQMSSSHRKYLMEQRQAFDEYNSQLATSSSEEKYNSELQKASRIAQAGMNPNLIGTDSASEASEMVEPESARGGAMNLPTTGDVISTVANLGKFVAGIADTGLAIATTLPDVMGKGIRNRNELITGAGIELNNFTDAYNLAKDYVKSFVGTQDFPENVNIGDLVMQKFQDAGLSPRARRLLGSGLSAYLSSADFETYRNQIQSQYKDAWLDNHIKNSSGIYEEFSETMNKVTQSCAKGLITLIPLEYDFKIASERLAVSQSEYDRKVLELKDPEKQALAENASFDADKALADIKKQQSEVESLKISMDKKMAEWQSKMLKDVLKSISPTSAFNPSSWAALKMASKILGYSIPQQDKAGDLLGDVSGFAKNLAEASKYIK